jgi:hypothetical protein
MQKTNERNSSRLRKGLCLIALVALLTAMVTAVNAHPATAYEASIYHALPTYFWLLASIPMVMPFVAVVYYRESTKDRFVVATLIAIALMALLMYLSLPVLRGYAFFSGGDSLTHLGRVVDIIRTGRIGKTNFYPAIHVWIYETSKVSNTSVISTMLLVPQYYTAVFVISMYSLAKALNSTRIETLITTALATLPIYGAEHLYVVPSAEAFFLVPLTTFILIKSRARSTRSSLQFGIPLLFMLILFPFFHPETNLFLLIIVAAMAVLGYSIRRNTRVLLKDALWGRGRLSIPMLISSASLLLWFSTTVAFGNTINAIYDSLALNMGQSPAAAYSYLLARANVNLGELVELTIAIYGVFLVLVVLGALVAARTLIRFVSGRRVQSRNLLLSGVLATLIPILLIFFFVDLVIGTRPMKYVLMISTLLAGISLTGLLASRERQGARLKLNRKMAIAGVFIAACLITLALIAAYPSPLTKKPNYQVTYENWTGMDYFMQHRNEDMKALEISNIQLRFADALMGVEAEKTGIGYGIGVLPVDHFGYNSSNGLGHFYSGDHYLIIDQMARDFYPTVYPEFRQLWRFTPEDFNHLTRDPTVNLVYDNGGLELFEIIGSNQ